jgi:hypothetical protein
MTGRFVHFGFALGLNVAKFRMQPVADLRIRDTVYTITPRPVTGLNLGIISNLRMGEHFDLRFIPALTFVQRNLEYELVYTDLQRETIIKRVESTYLEFPLDIKFKSKTNRQLQALCIGRRQVCIGHGLTGESIVKGQGDCKASKARLGI